MVHIKKSLKNILKRKWWRFYSTPPFPPFVFIGSANIHWQPNSYQEFFLNLLLILLLFHFIPGSFTVWQILCQVYTSFNTPNNLMGWTISLPPFKKRPRGRSNKFSTLKQLVNLEWGLDSKQYNSRGLVYNNYLVWVPPGQSKTHVNQWLRRMVKIVCLKVTSIKDLNLAVHVLILMAFNLTVQINCSFTHSFLKHFFITFLYGSVSILFQLQYPCSWHL